MCGCGGTKWGKVKELWILLWLDSCFCLLYYNLPLYFPVCGRLQREQQICANKSYSNPGFLDWNISMPSYKPKQNKKLESHELEKWAKDIQQPRGSKCFIFRLIHGHIVSLELYNICSCEDWVKRSQVKVLYNAKILNYDVTYFETVTLFS